MKAAALTALLLSGCMAMPGMHPAAPAADGAGTVRIVPAQVSPGTLPMVVTLRAEAIGLLPPLKFHWSLGNGREWEGPEPPVQFYRVGRYDVILTVTDGQGRVRKASLNIDAESHGCGV